MGLNEGERVEACITESMKDRRKSRSKLCYAIEMQGHAPS
jgi:hypothetical protein